jgi:AcrR family transcriptional regulator
MRTDAARRRQAITREARRLFAAQGSGVALESVADAAEVGIATLYRNFSSRRELIDAVVLAILADISSVAHQAVVEWEANTEAAWLAFLYRLVELDLGGLTDALSHVVAEELSTELRDAQDAALAHVEGVLGQARESRLADRDITALELILAIGILSRPQPEAIRSLAPELGRRLVTIFAAGIRP